MKRDDNIDELISNFLNRDRKALARIISLVENESDIARQVLSRLCKSTNNSYIIGVTGSPGTGKSTLITALVEYLSAKGLRIGIISVDPTSPYSGGAFLGDRVRMRDIILDPKVFIRSVASRGSMGGIAKAVYDIARLYDAYGMDYVLVETVGAGQSEVDIHRLAYTILLITVPGLGDSIQVQKAGILEIADILVINKSNLGGDFLKVNLNMMLNSMTRQSGWRPPIVRTIATEGKGTAELFQAIQDHREYMELSEKLKEKRRNNIRYKIQNLIESQLFKLSEKILTPKEIDKIITDVLSGSKDVYTVVHEILEPIIDKIEKI
ncbi:MAG: methylmalonyl Co-A mutase-associated GTPase MeaB [Candidatus Helarchaeota archaeon]|nr:methylmalonyl Co-A mutase-associated GTPase MeaB [Candidatus Helarchaeota archaeon]